MVTVTFPTHIPLNIQDSLVKPYRTIRLTIEYDGTGYSGWQRQRGAVTVQGKIEEVLEQLFQQEITLEGSGRTDAGVHALAQVASFRVDTGQNRGILKQGGRLERKRVGLALNSLLPNDIVVTDVREMQPDFHARHSARGKRYAYYVLNRAIGSALSLHRCYFFPQPLNVAAMRRAARELTGRRSFRAFASESFKKKSYVRNLSRLSISRRGDLVRFTLEADGFLYNMVRNIVGTLLEVGRGKMTPDDVRRIVKSGKRRLAGPKAPPHGLYLERVFY
ncbi:MAG: tRNA pseudouridine(38-40) synthase TruA [Planctomycetota bacterium]|nr:MAG: tRNA pseudouridine(38-40) synthase TruA [Planctomycetota bacterium]